MFEFLSTKASRILKEQFGISGREVDWEYSSEESRGDLSSAIALKLAKELQRAPKDIAASIAKGLKAERGVKRVEVADPGYINVWLKSEMLLRELNATRKACIAKVKRDEPPAIVDYCGPNIAKPLGIHHILPHVIGQAIVNVSKHLGCNVIGWSYPGDWGTQFGKLFVAYQRWGDGRGITEYTVDELLDLYVRFHREAISAPSLEDDAREAFRRLEEGDEEMRRFWEQVISVSREHLSALYHRLNISIDKETGESFYQDKMEPILKEGIERKVFKEGEGGALIAEFPEGMNMPPAMLKKGDGATLYLTRDLAMIRYRIDTYHPQAIYYLVDRAQSLHFQQLFETCRLLKWDLPQLEHTLFGRMSFKNKKMSTREGTVLKLEDVLDEAVKRADQVIEQHGEDIQTDNREELSEMMGIGALTYGILSQNRKMDIVFDWDKFLSFEGNSAPYLQYTHARARSVLRKAEVEEVCLPDKMDRVTDKERGLINVLLQFEKVLMEAEAARMPHILANYLYALCQAYNAFYNAEPILKAQEPKRALRLSLTSLTASVLKTGAELLTIRVPDRM